MVHAAADLEWAHAHTCTSHQHGRLKDEVQRAGRMSVVGVVWCGLCVSVRAGTCGVVRVEGLIHVLGDARPSTGTPPGVVLAKPGRHGKVVISLLVTASV